MARISGMVLGLGFLIVLSSLVSPASAWDDDDDDNHKHRPKYQRHHVPHGGRGLIVIPPRHVEHHRHDYPRYTVPQYPPQDYAPIDRGPIVPPPLPPSALERGYPEYDRYEQESLVVPPVPPADGVLYQRPGQFVNAAVPLYPHVRVKNQDEAPRHAVHQILAVKSPDPFRFPGCVYVKVCVPPGPCRDIKVEKGGAEIKLEYGEYEVEVVSSRGVITVEYDD